VNEESQANSEDGLASSPATRATVPRRPVSIRRRLIGRLLAGTLLLSFAADAAVYVHLRGEATGQFDEAMFAKAQAIAGLARVGADGESLKLEFSERAMPTYSRSSQHPEYFVIRHLDGRVLATSPGLTGQELFIPREANDPAGDQGFFDLALPNGRDGRAVWFQFQPATENAAARGPELLLVAASERDSLDETLWSVLLGMATVAAVLSVGTILLVMIVVGDALRPVRAMGDAATQIDAESLGYRFDTAQLSAELRPIGERLNDLLGRLEDAFRRERRFTANVAHELRTPIAEMRALADVAVKWPPPPETAAKNFRDVSMVAARMSAVVTSLLALVRSQAGQDEIEPEPIDLAAAVAEAYRPFAGQAMAKQLSVAFDVPPGLVVRTDRAMLSSLIANLLSNAVSHTPRGGDVQCRAIPEHDAIRLEFRNTNPGVTPADIGRITEPFWRRDRVRSEAGHAGIGLSLVKAYASALHLAVAFDVDESKTFRATVTLPRDASSATSDSSASQAYARALVPSPGTPGEG
jgi:two-component system sensor histidine kinase QseC